MSDKLEKFVRENRREFDKDQPKASVWDNIEAALPRNQVKRFSLRDVYKWSAAAAIIVAILTSGYFLIFQKNSHEQGSQSNPPVVTVTPNEPSSIPAGYAEEFKSVYRSIGEKEVELKRSTEGNPGLYSQFQKDMASLDSAYQSLMKQAEHSPNQDLLYEAIIENLKLRAELLSRQVMISRQFNNNTKSSNSHETSI